MSYHRYAVIFPGQGSQAIGMMQQWHEHPDYQNIVKDTFLRASEAISQDLWQMTQTEQIHDTKFTQPIIVAASYAVWTILQDVLPQKPSYLAGHSLGEYSALCAAGVLDFEDTIRLVHARGQFMQEAVAGQEVQMAAILGLEDCQVDALCQSVSQELGAVDAANFNSPGQVVVAGINVAVAEVQAQAKQLGARCVPLKVSVPSHCQLMKPAASKLAVMLEKTNFSPANIPVVQNINAHVELSNAGIKTALIEQLSKPVQWQKTMQYLADKQVLWLIECGFGNVLTNLCKRQHASITAFSTEKPEKLTLILEKAHES